ncbi:MAG: hypothetical protein R2758_09015 [Bacteroidales bacterium]
MNGTYNPAGYFNGDMTELVVFSGQLNDAERVVLQNNLGAKYQLPIADDRYAWETTHSHDVSGIAAYNGTTFTNPWSTGMLSVSSPTDLSEGEYLFFPVMTRQKHKSPDYYWYLRQALTGSQRNGGSMRLVWER